MQLKRMFYHNRQVLLKTRYYLILKCEKSLHVTKPKFRIINGVMQQLYLQIISNSVHQFPFKTLCKRRQPKE